MGCIPKTNGCCRIEGRKPEELNNLFTGKLIANSFDKKIVSSSMFYSPIIQRIRSFNDLRSGGSICTGDVCDVDRDVYMMSSTIVHRKGSMMYNTKDSIHVVLNMILVRDGFRRMGVFTGIIRTIFKTDKRIDFIVVTPTCYEMCCWISKFKGKRVYRIFSRRSGMIGNDYRVERGIFDTVYTNRVLNNKKISPMV